MTDPNASEKTIPFVDLNIAQLLDPAYDEYSTLRMDAIAHKIARQKYSAIVGPPRSRVSGVSGIGQSTDEARLQEVHMEILFPPSRNHSVGAVLK